MSPSCGAVNVGRICRLRGGPINIRCAPGERGLSHGDEGLMPNARQQSGGYSPPELSTARRAFRRSGRSAGRVARMPGGRNLGSSPYCVNLRASSSTHRRWLNSKSGLGLSGLLRLASRLSLEAGMRRWRRLTCRLMRLIALVASGGVMRRSCRRSETPQLRGIGGKGHFVRAGDARGWRRSPSGLVLGRWQKRWRWEARRGRAAARTQVWLSDGFGRLAG